MQRAHQKTFFIEIDEGISIEMYVPSRGQYLELMTLQAGMLKKAIQLEKKGIKDFDAATHAIDEVVSGWNSLNVLISKLCIDPSLTPEFFNSGDISSEDFEKIINGILNKVQGDENKTITFRPEQSGS